MSATEIRAELHQLIDQIDERFLKSVHAMVCVYQGEEPIGYEVDGSPIYGSILGPELDREIEAAENGNYITAKELDERSKEWLTRTK